MALDGRGKIGVVPVRKILIMGLPGAGKTTLAKELAPLLNAVHFNGDDVRHQFPGLGFGFTDRQQQAKRMGWLCDQVVKAGGYAIADFICPTPLMRESFQTGGEAFVVFVDRIAKSCYEDTNEMFVSPGWNYHVIGDNTERDADRIAQMVRPTFDPQRPTALFVGRYQPFHAGHKALIEEGLKRVGQVCVAVRDTTGLGTTNPFSFDEVARRISASLRQWEGRYTIVSVPNITHVFYGRDVGYHVERLDVDVEASGTAIRKVLGV